MDHVSALSHRRDGASGQPVRVAVDAMGGDHAPEEVVRGTLDWAARNPDVEILLVGERARVAP